jgi:aryl-alcohol dehydrogenase-like predicted oxidoreductase
MFIVRFCFDVVNKLDGAVGNTATRNLAIAWLLHQGEHIAPIPGTRSVEHLRQLAKGGDLKLRPDDLAAIERELPVGWAHGDRYSVDQWVGPQKYC